jgi:hypothetical protein
MSIKEKEIYYRIYYKKDGYIFYTDGTYDKNEALEMYANYIERYTEVAIVEIEEHKKIILGSL